MCLISFWPVAHSQLRPQVHWHCRTWLLFIIYTVLLWLNYEVFDQFTNTAIEQNYDSMNWHKFFMADIHILSPITLISDAWNYCSSKIVNLKIRCNVIPIQNLWIRFRICVSIYANGWIQNMSSTRHFSVFFVNFKAQFKMKYGLKFHIL